MSSGQGRSRKFRRSGQHTAPSQAAKVAQKAGKAAPAIAVAGALTVTPHVHKPAPRRAAVAAARPVVAAARPVIRVDVAHAAGRAYTIKAGDTLAGIAQKFYGQADAWPWLYQVNRRVIAGPGLLYAGQVLAVPRDPPAGFTAYRAPEAGGAYAPRHSADSPPATSAAAPAVSPPPDDGGTYSYAALEQLWVQAGGNPADQAFAACIAEHESGGNPGAISPTSDYGLWQIHDDPAALDPAVSAETAVRMSSDGTDWSPWTTEPDC